MLKHKIHHAKRGEGPLNMEALGRILTAIALVGVLVLLFRPVIKSFGYSDTAARVDAQTIADAIQKGLKSSSDKCMVSYGELKLGDPILLAQEGGQIKFYMQLGKKQEPLKIDPINARLCLVEGEAAKNLYSNIMRGTSSMPEYSEKNKYRIQEQNYADYKEKSYDLIITDSSSKETEIYTTKYYLYKADSSHVCFLSIVIDTGQACGWGSSGKIDEDCLREWTDGNKGNKEINMC